MTLGELTTQFQALMNNSLLRNAPTLASGFIQQSVQRIARELRIPAMEKSIVATLGASYNGLIIPGDLLELIDLEVDTGILRRTNLTRVKALARQVGIPREYSRQGKKWFIGPSPAPGSTIRIDYYADFEPLVDAADENVMTKVASDAIIYGALEYACDFYTDERGPAFGKRFKEIMLALQAQADADELTADAVVAPVSSIDLDCW